MTNQRITTSIIMDSGRVACHADKTVLDTIIWPRPAVNSMQLEISLALLFHAYG